MSISSDDIDHSETDCKIQLQGTGFITHQRLQRNQLSNFAS